MNKLMMFPLIVMFTLTIFAMVYTGEEYEGETIDMSESGQFNYTEDGTTTTGEIEIEGAGSQSFDIWGAEGALLLVIGAISVGIVAGINVLGSGLSELSQTMIFSGVMFLGLWACLTVVSSDFMFENSITELSWIGLTMIFVVGLGFHLSDSEGADS